MKLIVRVADRIAGKPALSEVEDAGATQACECGRELAGPSNAYEVDAARVPVLDA